MIVNLPPLDLDFSLITERRRARERQFGGRRCDAPGCTELGCYPAPRHRLPKHGVYWFCRKHVREYNQNWNYFEGMSAARIRAEQCQTRAWNGSRNGTGRRTPRDFAGDADNPAHRKPYEPSWTKSRLHNWRRPPGPRARRALTILGLRWHATLPEIRTRALRLIKRFHPDLNPGETVDPRRIRAVIWAWKELRSLPETPRP